MVFIKMKSYEMEKYQLRPRSMRGNKEPRSKRQPQPLSKYRRKTANARERHRMGEINRAFETLRSVVPNLGQPTPCEKLTKITTLRLAMKYITALSSILKDSDEQGSSSEDWYSPQGSDFDTSSCAETDPSTSASSTEDIEEDSLMPFDMFLAEFNYGYVDRNYVL